MGPFLGKFGHFADVNVNVSVTGVDIVANFFNGVIDD